MKQAGLLSVNPTPGQRSGVRPGRRVSRRLDPPRRRARYAGACCLPWVAWSSREDKRTPPDSAASSPTASSFQAPAPRSARVVVAEGGPSRAWSATGQPTTSCRISSQRPVSSTLPSSCAGSCGPQLIRCWTSTQPGPIDRCRRRGPIGPPAIWLRAGTERLEDRTHVRSGPGEAAPIQRPAELVPARVLGKRPGRDVVPHLARDVGPHARPLLGDETSRLPPHERGALAVEVDE